MCEQCLGRGPSGVNSMPGKPKTKPTSLILDKGPCHQAAVMDGGDQHVGRDNVRFAARPDGALQLFDRGHIFRGFQDFDNSSSHGQRGVRDVF